MKKPSPQIKTTLPVIPKGSFPRFAIPLVLVTIAVFLFSNNPVTGGLSLLAAIVSLIVILVYLFLSKKKSAKTTGNKIKFNQNLFVLMLNTFILFLIASTGWFFSPFFFMLYLWAIMLGFIYSPITTAIFTTILVGIFAVNIGQVDVVYDTLVVLSLLTVIPITFYLKKYIRFAAKKTQV